MTESGFLRWWLDQLASLVPARLSLPWSANNGSLTIEIDQQALTVIPPRAKEGIAIELATGGAGGRVANSSAPSPRTSSRTPCRRSVSVIDGAAAASITVARARTRAAVAHREAR